MTKESVKVLRFHPDKKFTHPAYKEKGWESIGLFDVAYYGLSVSCNLIRGKNTPQDKEFFYFLELPCARFLFRGQKWVKRNFFNFETKEESDMFQQTAFSSIVFDYPQLFDEVFLEERKKLAEAKQAQFNSPKARNKSKFAKE